MSFELQYKCTNCGRLLWSEDRPAEWDCECYIPEEKKFENAGIDEPIRKIERKARYRYQYKLNGFSWLGNPPFMFMGEFEEYPNRKKGEEE